MIVLLLFFLWYLSGFLPGRRIDKKNNRWHAFGIGGQIIGFVDGDGKWGLPWVSMPWPFRPINLPFPSRWNLFTTDGRKEYNSSGGKIEYNEKDIKKIENVGELLKASDITNRIRKQSRFIFDISIKLPLSGLWFEIVMPAQLKIYRPKALLNLEGDTLEYCQGEIDDSIDPWFTTEEIQWKKQWDKQYRSWEKRKEEAKKKLKDGEELEHEEMPSFGLYVLQKMEQLRIDDFDKNVIIDGLPFRQYLENRKFKKFGFKFGELSLKLGYGENGSVQDILKERRQQQVNKEKRNTNIANEKAQVVSRTTLINDSDAKKKATAKEWEINQIIFNAIYKGEKEIAEAYKSQVLVFGDSNEKRKEMVQQLTGALIAKKVELPKTKEVTSESAS